MFHERIPLDPADDRVYLDTYVVNDRSHLRSAFIVIPGGGYHVVCTEREGEPIALAYVAQDCQSFVLNYRVGPKDVYPSQMVDAGRAFLHVKENAGKYGVDPERIYFVGFSAGGHLAGSMATMYNDPVFLEAIGAEKDAVRPAGAVLAYPVTTAVGPCHSSSFENLLRKPWSEISDAEREKFSLERAVSDSTPPMFLWHTATDQIVPVQGTLMLARALSDHRVPYTCSIFPKGPHGLALASRVTDTNGLHDRVEPAAQNWVRDSVAFFDSLCG